MGQRRRADRVGVGVVAVALVLPLLVAAAAPTATPGPDRWTQALPAHGSGYSTFDFAWPGGEVSTTVVPDSDLPLELVVEQDVTSVLPLTELNRAVEFWNGVPGSRFSARITGVVATGARTHARDDVNRIFLGGTCNPDELARAHLTAVWPDHRYGSPAAYTTDADIRICQRLVTDPERVVSAVAHEVGHLLGLAHVDGSCRVMAALTSPACATLTDADRESVRYLYPTLPRLAGPTRLETSARAVYATVPSPASAATVVLADGFAGSALPVTAAALGGALDAPMLLTGSSCTGAPLVELDRVASPDAHVLLVGADASACGAAIRSSGRSTTTLADGAAVANHLAAERPVTTVFVVRGALADGNLPDGLTAAAAAGRLDAPILFAGPLALERDATAFLDQHPAVRQAVIVGGPAAVGMSVEADLRSRGLLVRRVSGVDRIGTALAVASMADVFPALTPVLVAGADRWADAVSGSAVGAAAGWPVLLTWPDRLDPRVATYLEDHATEGFVVGGASAVAAQTHLEATARVH